MGILQLQTRKHRWPRNISKIINICDMERNTTQGHNEMLFYTHSVEKTEKSVNIKCEGRWGYRGSRTLLVNWHSYLGKQFWHYLME